MPKLSFSFQRRRKSQCGNVVGSTDSVLYTGTLEVDGAWSTAGECLAPFAKTYCDNRRDRAQRKRDSATNTIPLCHCTQRAPCHPTPVMSFQGYLKPIDSASFIGSL